MAQYTALKEGKLFVETVMARLTGDQDKVIATRNARLAIAATKGQLSALDGELVKKEIAMELAEENLTEAKYPTTAIGDGEDYINAIKVAQDAYDTASEDVDSVAAAIVYFQAQLEEFVK